MSFILYDIVFFVVFVLAAVIFLYVKRKNLKRQGILFLYPTKIGIKIIELTTRKYSKILKPLQYLTIASGYALMAAIVWLILRFFYFYITSPTLAKELKIPVLTPLVPYIDKLFTPDLFPPLYFTYWIILIAIIAIPHEFAHGIFARLNKIKVHSTGFGFLGPFLAAFVEPDEKQIEKSKKFPQLSILAAGTFANVLVTILFAIIIWLFFMLFFVPSGVIFNTYSTSLVNINAIESVNGIPVSSIQEIQGLLGENITLISVNGTTFYTPQNALSNSIGNNLSVVYAFDDSPAFRVELKSPITMIDNVRMSSFEKLRQTLAGKSPGDNITIEAGDEEITLALADRDGKAFLGIGRYDLSSVQRKGVLTTLTSYLARITDPLKYNQQSNGLVYESIIGDFGLFIYNLLWWIILVSISVALMNMLPLGIFDGGRFFLLTVWSITGSKKAGEVAYKISTYFFLALLFLFMLKWFFAVF